MLTAIRQTVQVNADGLIEIHAPQLKPGQQAEVIVLVEVPEAAAQRAARLTAFFKQVQALPSSPTLTDADIETEIAAYRAKG
jgi:hypothetical protein